MADSFDEYLHGEGIENLSVEVTNEILSIKSRGAELYQNERAAWVATDMLFASNPDRNKLGLWFTEKVGENWYVYFGQYKEEVKQFKAGYVFVCTNGGKCLAADVNHQTENTNQFAAAVINAKRAQMKQTAYCSQVPGYNVNVFREKDSTITVYIMPGSTDPNIVFLPRRAGDEEAVPILHTHVTSDLPSATDVAFFLLNPHLAPHLVVTEHWLTRIDANGDVVVVDRNKFHDK